VFRELLAELEERGIQVGLARVRLSVRQSLEGKLINELTELVSVYRNVRDAVKAFQDAENGDDRAVGQ
jgi:hypothetical protein